MTYVVVEWDVKPQLSQSALSICLCIQHDALEAACCVGGPLATVDTRLFTQCPLCVFVSGALICRCGPQQLRLQVCR